MATIKDRLVNAFSGGDSAVGITLKTGEVFPLMELKTVDGKPPEPPRPGQRTVLWFYPKDNTPGCTLEGREFTTLLPRFESINVRVLGVSADNPESHKAFAQGCTLRTDLLTDDDGKLGQRIGNFREGRHVRTTVVLDDQLRVLRVYDPVKPLGHAQRVLEDIAP